MLCSVSTLATLLLSCFDPLYLSSGASGAFSPAEADLVVFLTKTFFAIKQQQQKSLKTILTHCLLFIREGIKYVGS